MSFYASYAGPAIDLRLDFHLPDNVEPIRQSRAAEAASAAVKSLLGGYATGGQYIEVGVQGHCNPDNEPARDRMGGLAWDSLEITIRRAPEPGA